MLYEACVTAGANFEQFAAAIECTEVEMEGFDFLVDRGIIWESRLDELVERRKEIRTHFEALARGEKAEPCQVKPLHDTALPLVQSDV